MVYLVLAYDSAMHVASVVIVNRCPVMKVICREFQKMVACYTHEVNQEKVRRALVMGLYDYVRRMRYIYIYILLA